MSRLDNLFKDPINGDFITRNLKMIVFSYDPENKVNNPYFNTQSPNYTLDHNPETKTIKVVINLSTGQRRDTLHHVIEKLDDLFLFGIRTAQFKAEQLLNDLALHVKNSLQFDIKFGVDYNDFISHPKFTSYNAAQRASFIIQLASNVNSLWRNVMPSMCQIRPRNNDTIKNHVKYVTVTYDCERDSFHNVMQPYMKTCYKVDHLLHTQQLKFTLAFSHASESLNYIKAMLEKVLDIVTAQ